MTPQIIRCIGANKPLTVIKKLLREEYLRLDRVKFDEAIRAEYDSLYPMYRDMTEEEFIAYQNALELQPEDLVTYDSLEVITQVEIDYSEDENYKTFEEYKNETRVITEAVEATYDEDGNVLTEAIPEVTELVRPYVGLTDEELEAMVESNELLLEYIDSIAKTTKEETLSKLTVTLTDGKVFYADAESRLDLRDAIQLGLDLGQDTTYWKLAEEFNGQRIVEVTIDELKEASKLALLTKGQIVGAV